MKKLFCLLFLLPLFAVAQKIITHTVGAKESLTSIGRLYNINGRELANYNKIDYDKGLFLGQVLKIPVSNAAPVTTAVAIPVKEVQVVKPAVISGGNGTPIYHTVAKKETLYHISTIYNKVPVADIKKWNNLTSDALSEGTKIIVGYSNTKTAVETKKMEEKQEAKVVEIAKPVKEENATVKKADEAEIKTPKKSEQKEVVQPEKNIQVNATPVNIVKASDFKGGFFKNTFDEQAKGNQLVNETGIGGVFKSTSGWEDGKYYCLHNNAAAGTIIKITNNATGKSIYAKVLDLIPDVKQNSGLIIRISNAAADVLGSAENKLDFTLSYSK
jgi:LysM repeat protein